MKKNQDIKQPADLTTDKYRLAQHLFVEELISADRKWYPDNRNRVWEWEQFVKVAAEESIMAAEAFTKAFTKHMKEEGGNDG
ncbi:MAG: hypothetical protein NC453_10910 [Muribaculum sp.]|nr:hypothetical protein [Muribaculum sp.]